jgi:hypothetical protein
MTEQTQEINYNVESFHRDLVLIYSPPKVGSTTLVSSIRASASDKFYVMHAHEDTIFKATIIQNRDIKYSNILHNNSHFSYKFNRPRKIYVIDVYRDPIERKISEFFQKISIEHFNNSLDNIANYNIDKINKRFNDIFPYISKEDFFLSKFDVPKFEKFDLQKKYLVHEKDNVIYIKLRLNDSHQWGTILSKLLDTEITIIPDYRTADKEIGEIYNKFKNSYELPYNYFKLISEDKSLLFYLSEKEKNNYLNYWFTRVSGLYTPIKKREYKFYKKICLENKFYEEDTRLHYKDLGCVCKYCSEKRSIFLENFKKGILLNDPIAHFQEYDIPMNTVILLIHTNEKQKDFKLLLGI